MEDAYNAGFVNSKNNLTNLSFKDFINNLDYEKKQPELPKQ